ncbi:MAG TPA: SIS domain-containing protein [Blastocatellia bacterium]|nr:SIS domain-containing protein [Blastocatellia bacterium]
MSKTDEDFSKTFYPFLHEDEKRSEGRGGLSDDLMDALNYALVAKARESAEVKTHFFEENKGPILQASLAMARAFHRGRKLLVCGNGGSATDAEHVATEFMHPITVGRRALPALSLTNDTATMTAVANDVSFADVFSRQIIALGRAGDVLLGISTSGNSENLLRAFETAKRMGLITIGYAGGDGGRMIASGAVDFCLTVPTASVHRVQETQVTLYHVMWDLVHELLGHRSLLTG